MWIINKEKRTVAYLVMIKSSLLELDKPDELSDRRPCPRRIMKDCPFRTEQTLAVQVIFLSALKIAIFHDLTFFFTFTYQGLTTRLPGGLMCVQGAQIRNVCFLRIVIT